MRSVLLRSLAVIGVGGLVLGGVLFLASTVDARAPQVVEVSLTQTAGDDARVGLITTSLEIVFSEPVDADGAADAVSLAPAVEGAVSWTGSTMIFTPSDPLQLETRYTLSVEPGIRDLAGNTMTDPPAPFEFETAGRPTVVETVPEDGAEEVAIDEPISLTFSTLMDTASVEAALRVRPAFAHDLRWSGGLLEIVPTEPMRPGQTYEVSIQADAADIAGVTLDEPVRVAFRTVAPGLAALSLVPADGVDGIATTSPVAIVFDRPIDPASADDGLLTITPTVAGTTDVVALPDDPDSDIGAGSLLRFTPSAPLPANTTFEVELAVGITAPEDGGGLAGPIRWTFTTGAPLGAISNHVTFVTDRAGIANVWAMNPDGTGQRQLTAELVPVVDYAVAPDGSSLVVANGRQLVFQRADGSERQVLTQDGVVEFDPAYAPNGERIAFGRADAATGDGLGLWQWAIGSGDAIPIRLPPDARDDEPGPSPSASDAGALRHPRYAPDGQALAFVDLAGSIGILELPDERFTRVPFAAAGPPMWLPGSGSLLLNGSRLEGPSRPATISAPVTVPVPADNDGVFRLSRSGVSVSETSIPIGSQVVAVATDGTIAYLDGRGALYLTSSPDASSDPPAVVGVRVISAAFSPGEPALVIVVGAGGESGQLELYEIANRRRTPLVPDGSQPRWLP